MCSGRDVRKATNGNQYGITRTCASDEWQYCLPPFQFTVRAFLSLEVIWRGRGLVPVTTTTLYLFLWGVFNLQCLIFLGSVGLSNVLSFLGASGSMHASNRLPLWFNVFSFFFVGLNLTWQYHPPYSQKSHLPQVQSVCRYTGSTSPKGVSVQQVQSVAPRRTAPTELRKVWSPLSGNPGPLVYVTLPASRYARGLIRMGKCCLGGQARSSARTNQVRRVGSRHGACDQQNTIQGAPHLHFTEDP
jgi:hypothetical protein